MKILKPLAAIAVAILLILGAGPVSNAIASATTLRVVQTPSIHLYSGISGSATSARVTPFPKDLDGTKLTMTDFGSTPTFTVDPKVSGYEEIISFTGMTDNGDNTATLTGLSRNLTSKYPYTTAGTGRTHGAGATVVFGNNPQVYGRLSSLENDQSFTGTNYYSIPPIINDSNATSTAQVASRAFVTQTAFGSTPVQKSAGGTGASSFPTGGYLYDSGAGTTLSATSSPTVGYIAATTTTATSTFAGNVRVSGAAYVAATSTEACSNVASNACVRNNVPYSMPSSQGAANTVATNDGSGNISWSSVPVARYVLSSTQVITATLGTAGGYATGTLMAIPASFMTSSSTIRVTGSVTCNSDTTNSDTGTIYLRDSLGNSYGTVTCTTNSTTIPQMQGTFEFVLGFPSVVTAQVTLGTIMALSTNSTFSQNTTPVLTSTAVNLALATSFALVARASSGGGVPTTIINGYQIVVSK